MTDVTRNERVTNAHAMRFVHRLPWLPLYIDDFMMNEDVRAMNLTERGAYIGLLCSQWRHGSLPASIKVLVKLADADGPKEWNAVERVVLKCFPESEVDGRRRNPRLEEERVKQEKRSEDSAHRARTSRAANAHVTRNDNTPSRASSAIESESESESEKEVLLKNIRAEFEQAWTSYPKRGGGNSQDGALRAFTARRRSGVQAEDLLRGVERYAAFCRVTGAEHTKFVKTAAAFFGPDRHWTEPWDPPPPTARNGTFAPAPVVDPVTAAQIAAWEEIAS